MGSCTECRREVRLFLALEEVSHRERSRSLSACAPAEVLAAQVSGRPVPDNWVAHLRECVKCRADAEALRSLASMEPGPSEGSLTSYLKSAGEFFKAPGRALPAFRAGLDAVPLDWRGSQAQQASLGEHTVVLERKAETWIVRVSPPPKPPGLVLVLSRGALQVKVRLMAAEQEVAVGSWESALLELGSKDV